ncbi:MAG TPA: EAL domain-containing protein, partial [Candidatus Limnocylindrales bacterium]
VVPYPSLADIPYLAGYVALVAGSTGLVRRRAPGMDRTAVIDAAILATGAAALFWVVIMEPSVDAGGDLLATGVSLAYPGVDLILLAIGVRALLGGGVRPWYLRFLLGGIALYFVADVSYATAVVNGTYTEGGPLDAVWVVGVLLMGVASLHPSVSDTIVEPHHPEARLSRARFALLAGAAMLAPAILLIQGTKADESVIVGVILTWTVLFGLVLVRLAATVDELGVSLLHRRRLQDDLVYNATHDPLTRLASRSLFESRLTGALADDADGTALIFLDLDDFKTINDTLGHTIGDELLQAVAARLQRGMRRNDLAARLGGDEFAFLIEHCPDDATVRAVAERILGSIRAPVELAGRLMSVHASAGIALGRAGATGMDLMRDADVAMYQAKARGKDQVEQHEPAMHDAIVRGFELRTELAAAIEAEAFVVEFQPVIELETGIIVGAEALVRWQHPERGMIPPGEFISIAESSGLIHPLGRWILRHACAVAASWPALPDGRDLLLSVNLAPTQLLLPRLVDDVADTLAETGLPPARLVLEVTESALTDLGAAREALGRLHQLGTRLALDDFGTGYSALNYLADLPFDVVKIDRSFTANLGDTPRLTALLDGILRLCGSLDLRTVAEGIETESQLAQLKRLGCRYGQGFLFARPMPEPAFVALLASSTVIPAGAVARPRRMLRAPASG